MDVSLHTILDCPSALHRGAAPELSVRLGRRAASVSEYGSVLAQLRYALHCTRLSPESVALDR
jgi:hypothetical protein